MHIQTQEKFYFPASKTLSRKNANLQTQTKLLFEKCLLNLLYSS